LTVHTDADLYARGAATLLASWAEYARGAEDAALQQLPGVAAGVFPHAPERSVYNNALLERGLPARDRVIALDAMEAAYAAAGVSRFAVWIHESDHAMQHDLEQRGYRIDATSRAMGMGLDDTRVPRPQLELAPPDWREHLRIAGVPAGFLALADPGAYRVVLARLDDEIVATGMAYHFDGDCGIYNVGTAAHARRQGLGSGVTAALLRDALMRGCETASLQATPMAERLYASLGFRDLGRILEYVPPAVFTDGRKGDERSRGRFASGAPRRRRPGCRRGSDSRRGEPRPAGRGHEDDRRDAR
jgi:ribosomal protein S18 acetylase RimI-like enzyme